MEFDEVITRGQKVLADLPASLERLSESIGALEELDRELRRIGLESVGVNYALMAANLAFHLGTRASLQLSRELGEGSS